MITFIVHVRVAPGNQAAFIALMAEVVATTRAREPGVVHYALARSVDEADGFCIVEVYADAAAHAAHMAAPWVRDSLPRALALMEGRPQIRQYVSDGSAAVATTVASS